MRFLATVWFLTAMILGAQEAPKHKNLKVLKDDDVRAVMGAMQGALGQKCTFCHDMKDFASDENPKKLIARGMMELANDINGKFHDGKTHVTCYTCHRGSTTPETAPPPTPPAQ